MHAVDALHSFGLLVAPISSSLCLAIHEKEQIRLYLISCRLHHILDRKYSCYQLIQTKLFINEEKRIFL